MMGKRTVECGLVVALILGVVWAAGRSGLQLLEGATSLQRCEDDLKSRLWDLEGFARRHAGRLPTRHERELLFKSRGTANTGLECRPVVARIWNDATGQSKSFPPVPLAWCGAPHGTTWKWRNVLFTDFTQRRVAETDFHHLLHEHGIHE